MTQRSPTAALALALSLATACVLVSPSPLAAQPEAAASDQLIRRPAIGLTARLPVGASETTMEIAGRRTTSIVLPGNIGIVNVSDRTLARAQKLPDIADSIIRQHLDSVSESQIDAGQPTDNRPRRETARGRVLDRQTRTINGAQAEVFSIETAAVGGENTVFSYALFMPTPKTLGIIEMQTSASMLARTRPFFELIVGTVAIADPSLTDAQRELGVEASIAFFQSLSPSDYEAVIGALGDEWHFERFYRPAATGSDTDATERGYRRTRYALGTRTELKGPGARATTSTDRQQGFLVFQEARILHPDYIVDIAASFFMTPDRRQEGWSIKQAVKPRKLGARAASTNTVETGIRDGNSVTVVQSVDGKPVETINPLISGKGYISRAEVYLLPHLLLHKEAAGHYRAYAYNQLARKITLREDILVRPEGSPGMWKYISRPDEENPGQTAYFDARHDPVRAELPNDELWEPISLKRLFELWKDKNLPLD